AASLGALSLAALSLATASLAALPPAALSAEPAGLRALPLSVLVSALPSAALAPPALASPPLTLRSLTVSATAAANASFLSGLGPAVFRVPSAPGRPLNFCQSPVISRSLRTGSVGCAPTDSQYWARSESTSMRDGSTLG